MQRSKVIAIEVRVLIILWLIVAVSCSAYVFNEKPEDIENPVSDECNTQFPRFPLADSQDDSSYYIESWAFANKTCMEK